MDRQLEFNFNIPDWTHELQYEYGCSPGKTIGYEDGQPIILVTTMYRAPYNGAKFNVKLGAQHILERPNIINTIFMHYNKRWKVREVIREATSSQVFHTVWAEKL